MMHNLLTDPLIPVSEATRRTDGYTTLPGLLAMLARPELRVTVGRLQAHQQIGWRRFIAQLAAMAVQLGDTAPHTDPESWTARLLTLTDGDPDAWALCVEDESRPAFMQPPVPAGARTWRSESSSPSDLDTLPSRARNHDIKAAPMRGDDPWLWVSALVALQTGAPYIGIGNYGVSRAEGPFGAQGVIGLYPALDDGAMCRADVQRLLAWCPRTDGHRLLWLLPWSGDDSLSADGVHPLAVEVARRVRLRADGAGWVAQIAPTKVRRVVGDIPNPWVLADGAVYPKAGVGWTCQRTMRALLAIARVLDTDAGELLPVPEPVEGV